MFNLAEKNVFTENYFNRQFLIQVTLKIAYFIRLLEMTYFNYIFKFCKFEKRGITNFQFLANSVSGLITSEKIKCYL